MENYIKKVPVKAKKWDGTVQTMLIISEAAPDYSFSPNMDGSLSFSKEGEKDLNVKIGEAVVIYKGEAFPVKTEDFVNDYYAERSTSKKSEDKPKRKRRTKAEIEAEKSDEPKVAEESYPEGWDAENKTDDSAETVEPVKRKTAF